MSDHTTRGFWQDPIPAGWELVATRIDHPDYARNAIRGDLLRCVATGVYRLWCGGVCNAVPQDWAATRAAEA